MDNLSPTESAASGGPVSVDQPAGAADDQSDLDGGNESDTQTPPPAYRRRSAPQFAPDHDLHLSDSGDESMADDHDIPQQQQPQKQQQTGGGRHPAWLATQMKKTSNGLPTLKLNRLPLNVSLLILSN